MSASVPPDVLVAGLRAAGWSVHGPNYNGVYTANTALCHGGDSPDKLYIRPASNGGFTAYCFTLGCGRKGSNPTQAALGLQLIQAAHLPAPERYTAAPSDQWLIATYQHPDGKVRQEFRRDWPQDWPAEQQTCPFMVGGGKSRRACGKPRDVAKDKHSWMSKGLGVAGTLARVIHRSADPADPVYLCEGPKAANYLAALGYPAANWYGGGGAVTTADFSPLAGARVTLWPDWDKSGAGERAMQWAAYRLRDLAAAIAIVPPYYAGGDKADAADCPAGEVAAHLAKAQPYEVTQEPPPVNFKTRPAAARPPRPAIPQANGSSSHGANGAKPPELRDFHDIGKWYGRNHLGGRWLYDPELNAWLRYDGKIWMELETHQLHAITDQVSDKRWGLAQELKDSGQDLAASLMASAREWRTARGAGGDFWTGLRTVQQGQLPKTPLHILAVPNGVVDLRQGKLHPHRPSFGIRALAAGNYRPDDHSKLRALLRRRLEKVFDDLNFDALCGYIGLTLTGRAQARKGLVMILGKSGSGKSGTLNLIKDALGGYSFSANKWLEKRPLGDIDATLVDVLEKQPRMIVCEEVGQGSSVNINRLLTLTGYNEDSARRPHGTLRSGYVIGAIWTAAVNPPEWRMNDGLKRRLAFIKSLSKLPDDIVDDSNEHSQDLLDAVITVGIAEAAAVYRPDYSPPAGDSQANAEILAEMDELMAFVESLPEEWNGRLFSDLLEHIQQELDESISANILGRKLTGSERWIKVSPSNGRNRKKEVVRLANPPLLVADAGDCRRFFRGFSPDGTRKGENLEKIAGNRRHPGEEAGAAGERWCFECAVYYYEQTCPHCAVEVEVGDAG